MNFKIIKHLKSLFGKITNQSGFFAPGPTEAEEKKIGELLFIRSANANLSEKILKNTRKRFPNAKITMFSTWTLDSKDIIATKLYDDLIFIPLEHDKTLHRLRKKEVLKNLKSKIFPLIIVTYSPEFTYYRMQLLPFILRKNHLLIFNENLDSFYFNNYHRKVILNHFLSRLPISYIIGDSILGFIKDISRKTLYITLLPLRYTALFISFLIIFLGGEISRSKR